MSSKRRPSNPRRQRARRTDRTRADRTRLDDLLADSQGGRPSDQWGEEPAGAPDEVTTVARDPYRGGRVLRLLPLLLAALVSVPLLWLTLAFSLEVGEIAVLLVQLDADGWTQFGVILMTLSGFICLVAVIAFLFIGWRRDTWRWRWSWAGAVVLAAAFLPLLFVLIM